MANLPEEAAWRSGIYQIEMTDPVVGGPDGISNIQARQLGDRTAHLKQELDSAKGDFPHLAGRLDELTAELSDLPFGQLRAFGAAADGVADDAGAFARIGVARHGRPVDLGGRSCRVSVTSTAARYFNGSFLVDGQYIETPARERLSPFEGQVSIIGAYPGTHWSCGVWYDDATQLVYRVEALAERHDVSSGGRIDLLCSRDMGATWADRRTIFSHPDHPRPRAGAFTLMGAGRYGGLVTTGDTTRRAWFVWSDDYGVTWSLQEISGLSLGSHFVHGLLMPGPSGAEGDWMVASYGGTRAAKWLRTLNNGATWTDRLLRDAAGLPGPSPNPAEPSIVHVPGRGWLMFIRLETNPVSAQNMWASASTDGLIYGRWVDTGVRLGSNPAHALYEGGQIHVLCAQRTGFSGTERPNTLFRYSLDAHALFDDPSLLGRRAPAQIAALPARAIGYLQSCRLMRGPQDKYASWLHILKSEGESPTGRPTSSYAIAMRDLPAPDVSVAAAAISPVQLIENPIFDSWPRGDGFVLSSADAGLAGRWRGVGSGATLHANRVVLTEAQSRLFPFRPRSGMRIHNLGTPEDYVGISQRWIGDDARRLARTMLTSGRYVARIWGVGPFPPGYMLTGSLAANGATFASGPFEPVAQGATAAWVAEAEILASAIPTSIETIETLTFGLGAAHDVIELDLTLTGVFLYPLNAAAQMDVAPLADQQPLVERYCRRMVGAGAALGSGVVRADGRAVVRIWHGMAAPPAVTFSDPGHFVVEAATDHPVTAFDAASTQNWVVIGAASGAPLGQAATIKGVGAGAWTLFDTGF